MAFLFNLLWFHWQSCLVQPYLNVVHRFGIQIKPFFIGIYTTRLNGCLNQTVHNNKAWIKSWFNFGLIVTLITIPVSFYLVIQPLIGRLFEIKQNQSYSSLQPIVNVNLNSSQLDYLYLILSYHYLCFVIFYSYLESTYLFQSLAIMLLRSSSQVHFMSLDTLQRL